MGENHNITLTEILRELDAISYFGPLREKLHRAIVAKQYSVGQPTLSLDFDGVLHSYKSGWQGAHVITDEPVDLAIEWLNKAMDYFRVTIFSNRCNDPRGIAAMAMWLKAHGCNRVHEINFEPGKPAWNVHIDDRCIRFDGDWREMPTPLELINFRPWYYEVEGWR